MTAKSKTEPAPPRAVRNVKTVPIDAIHCDPGNVRVHPERNKATIRASLARFGAGRSIVLDGNNVVRAGNGTVEQARDAGYTEVLIVEPGPNQIVAVKRPDWSDSVGTAYSIADNTSTDQSEDDQSRLAATLSALRNDGFDLAAMGHSSEGLDELLKTLADEALADEALADGTPAEDPGPQIDRADGLQKKWATALGQLWVIPSKTANGEHRILCGDSTQADDVARVCNGQVQMCVTSPPYWGLRSYGIGTENGELGLEATPSDYTAKMVALFAEVGKVLRDDGTCWVNIGDSYAQTGGRQQAESLEVLQERANRKGYDVDAWGAKTRDGQGIAGRAANTAVSGLKPKDLCGIPWRLAFALQADGWYLRMDIIWEKPNPMPESVTDRPTKAHEYIFLLSKNQRYFFDSDAVREQMTTDGKGGLWGANRGPNATWAHDETHKGAHGTPLWRGERNVNPAGRNIRSVWTITPQPFPMSHFATFPVELAARCIAAGTSERGACPMCGKPWERVTETENHFQGGSLTGKSKDPQQCGSGRKARASQIISTLGWRPTCKCPDAEPVPCQVFDPFLGAATTIVACEQAGRLGRGIELSPQYVAIALERLEGLGLRPVLA